MFRRLLLLLGPISLALCVSCAGFFEPTEQQISREFAKRKPGARIVKFKRTWEEVAVTIYEIEFTEDTTTAQKAQMMLHQCVNYDWRADYRECGK